MKEFDFAIDTKGMATIKVSKTGLVFSAETIKLLGKPKQVLIGIDFKNSLLCVKPYDSSIVGKPFEFCTTEQKKKWIRIKSGPIISVIQSIAQIEDINKTTTFLANYSEETNEMIVDLKQNNKEQKQ